jgi:hypothetical protein
MWPLLLISAYILAHAGLYAGCLRQRPAFRRERTIFLYHLCSWIAGVCVFGILGLMTRGWPVAGVFVVLCGSLHGIYSLSFLELWSLSQGSYSLSILAEVERDPSLQSLLLDTARLGAIGQQKRNARLISLQQLGLLNQQGIITGTGRGIAAVIAGIIWLTKGRNLNH